LTGRSGGIPEGIPPRGEPGEAHPRTAADRLRPCYGLVRLPPAHTCWSFPRRGR